MISLHLAAFAAVSLVQTTIAVPLPLPLFGLPDLSGSDTSSAATSLVSANTVTSTLLRPAQFSRVAYCSSAAVTSWSCGAPCDSLGSNIKVLQAGGGKSYTTVGEKGIVLK